MLDNLKIASLNVKFNPLKRKRVLEKLKKDGSQVAFLQETHLSKKEQAKVKFTRYSTFFFIAPVAIAEKEE